MTPETTPSGFVSDEILDALEQMIAGSTEGTWTYGLRVGDEDAPASICSGVATGRARAIAMCPRYGLEQFRADAESICVMRNNARSILRAARDRNRLERENADQQQLLKQRTARIEELEWLLNSSKERISALERGGNG